MEQHEQMVDNGDNSSGDASETPSSARSPSRHSRTDVWRTSHVLAAAIDQSLAGTGPVLVSRASMTAWIRAYVLRNLWTDPFLKQLREEVREIDNIGVVVVLVALAKCEAIKCVRTGLTASLLDGIVGDVLQPYIDDYFDFAQFEGATESSKDLFGDEFLADLGFPEFFNDATLHAVNGRLKFRTVRDVDECVGVDRTGTEHCILACELLTRTYGHLPLVNDFLDFHRTAFRQAFERFWLTNA